MESELSEAQPPIDDAQQTRARSSFGFAALLAILGSGVVVAATVLPFDASGGQGGGHLVELDSPFKIWVWTALQLWGTALAIVVTAIFLIRKPSNPLLPAAFLIAFGVETTLLFAPILGQVLVTEGVDPRAGAFLGAVAGPIVLAGGILAYRACKRLST